METEVPQVPASIKEPSRRAAAAKKTVVALSETSDEEGGEDEIDDEDFDVEPVNQKNGGKKPTAAASSKTAKPPAVSTKKRGPANKTAAGQKLLTNMFKASENTGISPEKKVRKMRASPFNKKSSSVLGRTSQEDRSPTSEESLGSEESDEVVPVIPSRTRPQRARQQKRYVISDSETEQEDVPDDDSSDFTEDEASE